MQLVQLDFDDLLHLYVGEFGSYQILIYVLLCFLNIPASINNLIIIFSAVNKKFYCNIDELNNRNFTFEQQQNLSAPYLKLSDGSYGYDNCKIYERNYSVINLVRNESFNIIDCQKWNFPETHISSIISDWSLVCSRKFLLSTSTAIYMSGLMTGVVLFGGISDKLGRKKALYFTTMATLITGISISFANNIYVYTILRFFQATTNIAVMTNNMVFAMEFIGKQYRPSTGMAYQYFWAIGCIILPLFGYCFKFSWRYLHLSSSLILLGPTIVYICVLDESPRWLYTKNHEIEADRIINKVAKFNKKELPKNFKVIVQNDGKLNKSNLFDLIKTSKMRSRSMASFFIWFTTSLVYYGLQLNVGNLGDDIYLNFLYMSLVELPAYFIGQISVMYIGRRYTLSFSLFFSGVILLVVIPLQKIYLAKLILAITGKLSISISFAIVYFYTIELYPTVIRNIGISSSSFFARLGAIIVPFIVQSADYRTYIPMLIFGILGLIAGIISFIVLPETKGIKLPETILDIERKFERRLSIAVNDEEENRIL